MLLRRYGIFTGGIDLPDEKDATLRSPIRRCPPLERLRVPLAPCGASAAEAVVAVGQHVHQGDRIAQAAGACGVDVFAPLSGRVSAMTTAVVAGAHGLSACRAIELTGLSAPPGIAPARPRFEWDRPDAAALRAGVAESGALALCRNAEPLAAWVERARSRRCRVLIADLIEDEPYVTVAHRLVVEHGEEVVCGLALLARAIGAERVFMAADHRRTDRYQRTAGPARRYGIIQVGLPHKYPTGAAPMLVKILTRRETPPGESTLAVGAAVVDVATCFAAYRAVVCGEPVTARVVTVSGQRAAARGNFYVPFGADCAALVAGAGGAIIHGGPMRGRRCTGEEVVGPATNAVLAIEAAPSPVPGPCIRCGWCTDHCPARLNVAALNDAFELALVDRAEHLGAMACVECGVCSYVCPARLPLTQRVKRFKRVIERGRSGAPAGGRAAGGERGDA